MKRFNDSVFQKMKARMDTTSIVRFEIVMRHSAEPVREIKADGKPLTAYQQALHDVGESTL